MRHTLPARVARPEPQDVRYVKDHQTRRRAARRIAGLAALGALVLIVIGTTVFARNPIRRDFFDLYPQAENTQLDDLPSNAGHCGVCHFDFDGGGARNPYGSSIEVGIQGGLTNTQAIQAVEGNDADNDGFTNLTEITNYVDFGNTPTFPGLSITNYGGISNVTSTEVEPYLTPSGGTDTTPPDVQLLSFTGGESVDAETVHSVDYTATDSSGVAHVNIYMSDESGSDWKLVGKNEPPTGTFSWFVPNRPGVNSRIRVEAIDTVGNAGDATSASDFTINGVTGGVVPTTLRDMDLPGTQPFEGAVLDDPNIACLACHGNYDTAVEPWYNWKGSMMGQAMRDPLFLACLAIAEQDAPSVGDLCLRCHTPGGWQEGRSVDTSGESLIPKDFEAIQCDFCHRAVDHNYVAGVSPIEDVDVLAALDELPAQYGNGQFVNDPNPLRRGPYADAQASHAFVESPFHRSSDMCGICHDVSNPVFVRTGTHDYAPNAFDDDHPDGDLRNMFPVERTYSEWSQSDYANGGVFAPEFAGDKPDGIVSSCQDCHMRDVTGKGCNEGGAPTRSDLPLHDFTGGNTFIPDILPAMYPGEVDVAQLQSAKARATAMLQLASSLDVTPTPEGLTVRVTNETGHKLPSGYPEGRRIWVNVKARDTGGIVIYESGAYDFGTAELTHDEDLKIYETHPGLSPALAAALGQPAGESFHFVLSDTVYFDTRIPPRGFTNANFETIQSPPVAYSYADGQYWDDTDYVLPVDAVTADVTIYYQSTTKEYIEFLRDANTTNSAGQDLYDAWVAQGKAPPVVMNEELGVPLNIVTGVDDEIPVAATAIEKIWPNPAAASTNIRYALQSAGRASIQIFDPGGRLVRTLVDGNVAAGVHSTLWNLYDDRHHRVTPGVYFVRFDTEVQSFQKKILVLN